MPVCINSAPVKLILLREANSL